MESWSDRRGRLLPCPVADRLTSCERGLCFSSRLCCRGEQRLQNLRLPLELGAGVSDDERLLGLLEQVGLSRGDAGKRPGQLSGGMQMRLSLARALVCDPQVLLLDEPFAAVDDFLRMKLQDNLRALHDARGLTTILVTHNLQEAAYLSDRVVVLQPSPRGLTADLSAGRSQLSAAERRRAPEQFQFLQQLTAALFPS